MLKFTPIYAILVQVYAIIRLSQNPRTIGHARFLGRNFWAPFVVMKWIYDLRQNLYPFMLFWFTFYAKKIVRTRTHARSDARDFYALIFGPHSSLWNRSTIYAKICTHLRWFGSRFTLKSTRPRTRARSDARDFYAVIFGGHSSLWNRSTIYAKIRYHLCWIGSYFTLKSASARTVHDRIHAYLRGGIPGWGFLVQMEALGFH
jgi:hypothetical protein